jgi:butyryl-CoA dehydrogenase
MRFELTEDQKAMQDAVRAFVQKDIAPRAREIDAAGQYPGDLVKQAAALGLCGVTIPVEYEGAGMDSVSYCIAIAEISGACASLGTILSVTNSLVCEGIRRYGSEAQWKRFLPDLASGRKVGCYCLSEPEAGSDSGNQKTTAVRDGDAYVLNGTKNFITNGVEADIALVMAVTDKAKGKKGGISAFVVETKTPGFKPGPPESKLGLRCSPTVQIHFDDCRVPAANRLEGLGGDGFKIALGILDCGRVGIAAQALGVGRAALAAAVTYAQARRQFGKAIAEFQSVQWMIADMATELDAAELLVFRAAVAKDTKARFTREASMAKLYASEAANRAARKAVQIHGGYGYTKDYEVERHFRDARITEIYEGTSEIQRLVIATQVLKGS